jgi:hypothetical protein
MVSGLQESTLLLDLRDTLTVLTKNPKFILNNGQYEDVLFCITEVMELEISNTLEKIQVMFGDRTKLPNSFIGSSEDFLELVYEAAVELALALWRIFKNMNMFDIYGSGDLTFPFVLTGVIGSNLVLIKDNIISSNEVNVHGSHF